MSLSSTQVRTATVWHRAGIVWRLLAIAGVVSAVGIPLSLACGGGLHGVSKYSEPTDDIGDFAFGVVLPLLISGCAFLTWMEIIRSGRLAWLWATPWAVFAAVMLVCTSLNVATGGVSDIWVAGGQLALYGLQIWVAWKAWKLGRAGSIAC